MILAKQWVGGWPILDARKAADSSVRCLAVRLAGQSVYAPIDLGARRKSSASSGDTNHSVAFMIRALLLVVAVRKPICSPSSLITSAPAKIEAVSALNCIPLLTCQRGWAPKAG